MKNSLKASLFAGLILGATALPALAERQGFYKPTITFSSGRTYRVSKCIDSFRYQNPCTSTATDEIAKNFCKRKGYKGDSDWNTVDVGWNNRRTVAVRTDQWENGERWKGWKAKESSILFEFIECYK